MKSLKSLVVWLLLLALPLQGFAAVSMSLCNKGGMSMGAVSTVVSSSAQAEMAPAMPAGCEHHDAAPAADESAGSQAKCSTCAAGSVGAAIVAALPSLPQFNAHDAGRIAYVAAHDTACIYGALERPPLTVA